MSRWWRAYDEAVDEGGFESVAKAWSRTLERLELAAKISKYTESPIETMLGLALMERAFPSGCVLIPQLKWRRYRVDWAIRRPDKTYIFIECDGREFHSKPEDVARDRARDAEIMAAGIKILRFTGAEIFADAAECALRVCEAAI